MQLPQRMQPVRLGPSPPKKGSGTSTPGLSKKTPTRVLVKVSPTPISSPYSCSSLSAGPIPSYSTTPSMRSAVS